ncbi:MAG TPA: hypothetical protein VFB06_27125 [Streptosporangiaceae bacterium]|nr:hypothetical protein [Streptosporangiaceae bacterium]
METNEPVTRDEASAALASVRDSRRRVAWRGYPAWYWPATGAALGGLSLTIGLSGWRALAATVPVAAALVIIALAAGRARGVCEGWAGGAARQRERIVLYGPAALVILAGAIASKFASWPPVAAAVLLFVLFAGTGLTLSARAARR